MVQVDISWHLQEDQLFNLFPSLEVLDLGRENVQIEKLTPLQSVKNLHTLKITGIYDTGSAHLQQVCGHVLIKTCEKMQ